MNDQQKTKEQLVDELAQLRRRVASVEKELAQHKRTEEALRATIQRQESWISLITMVAQTLPDLIWAKDMEGKYLFVNKAMCEKLLNARDTEEPLGKTDLYFARREQQAHPENPQWYTFG